ncbi:MAG: R3H domain-containing nucleic acid-binding protein [Candidatus Wildermuthbacteria bacterium]|nr:R3H domain-containing nucleic acid-binding protein [Candidatus Wildermuthbacteria bacterium]
MLDKNDLKSIKKIVEEFFEKMSWPAEVEIFPQRDFTLPIDLRVEEPQVLIGQGGETLAEIQHLLKIILKRQIIAKAAPEEKFYIDLDINDYKKKKAEYLKEMARDTADDVSFSKKEKELTPMSAYERRIVHMEVAQRTDVSTESIGEGPDRRIIIKPRP